MGVTVLKVLKAVSCSGSSGGGGDGSGSGGVGFGGNCRRKGRPTWCLVAYLIGKFSPQVLENIEHSALHPCLEAGDAFKRFR